MVERPVDSSVSEASRLPSKVWRLEELGTLFAVYRTRLKITGGGDFAEPCCLALGGAEVWAGVTWLRSSRPTGHSLKLYNHLPPPTTLDHAPFARRSPRPSDGLGTV